MDEAIEKHDANVKRDLLARDGVKQGFEDRRVARRFETGELSDEWLKMFLRRREGIESAEIDLCAEQVFNFATQSYFGSSRNFSCSGSDSEAGTRRRARLLDGEFDDLVFERERAAICLTVPAIEKIFGAAAKDPYGEVKTKWRHGAHLERNCVERKRRADRSGNWHSFLWTFSIFDIIYRIEKQCKCSG